MRILQVVPYFYPAFAYGGPVKVSYEISKKLVERGHDVVVYTSDMKDGYSRIDSESEDVNGIKVHYFPTFSALAVREMKLFIMPEIISTVKKKRSKTLMLSIFMNTGLFKILLFIIMRKNIALLTLCRLMVLFLGFWRNCLTLCLLQ
jgi:glycosyltransferase involved in cell wall biosynthesis